MKIVETANNIWHEAVVEEINPKDLKFLTQKRYFFNWKEVAKQGIPIYKLRIWKQDDIKGLMSLLDIPSDKRIEIALLTASRENVVLEAEKGKKKKAFDRIIGSLIAYACEVAFLKYREKACVSLLPKTAVKEHYISKYGMVNAGPQLFVDSKQLNNLIIKYML